MFLPEQLFAKSFQENPLTKAILLFDKQNFKEAEPLFRKILDERPDDFMVNYFYGACRTENGHYSENDLSYLLKASKEVTPLDIDYYFGVQYHAANNWDKALLHYRLYKAVASANDQEKVNLNIKIDQCSNKINPFQNSQTATSNNLLQAEESKNNAEIETNSNIPAENTMETDTTNAEIEFDVDTELNEKTQIQKPEELEEIKTDFETTIQSKDEEIINFNINSEITYLHLSNFKTADGETYFREGNIKQSELEETVINTEELREKYKLSKSRPEKDSIGKQILEFENRVFELRNITKQLFLQAKAAESSYWQNAPPLETEKFIRELDMAGQEIRKRNSVKLVTVTENTELLIPPVILDEGIIEKTAPKPKSTGISYKIQLGAYSRGIPNNMRAVFNKISVIRKVENYTDEKGVVVYTTGNLSSYQDALVMQKQVQQEGIKDAIIAAYLNGKRIPLEQAKEIETEQ